MLTRRRFAAFVAAALSSWRMRPAWAANDLPKCSIHQTLDKWNLGAWYPEKAADASYSIDLGKATIELPNCGGSLGITTFELDYDGDDRSYGLSCDSDWPDGSKASGPVSYELVNAGSALLSFNLTPDKSRQELGVGEATLDRMTKNDTTVQVIVGGESYQLVFSGQSFHQAMVTAQALAKHVKAEHDRKACTEIDNGGCVLTTAACQAVGLPDDCFELRTMRRLRDHWILAQPFGSDALRWYYATSSAILSAMPSENMRPAFLRFYVFRVVPAVLAERLGWHGGAYRWLKKGVERLAAIYTGGVNAGAIDASR